MKFRKPTVDDFQAFGVMLLLAAMLCTVVYCVGWLIVDSAKQVAHDYEPVSKVIVDKGEWDGNEVFVTAGDRTYASIPKPLWQSVKIGDTVTQPRKYWTPLER